MVVGDLGQILNDGKGRKSIVVIRGVPLSKTNFGLSLTIFFLIVLCLGLTLALAFVAQRSSGTSASARATEACTEPVCMKYVGESREDMNDSLDPCSDFYQYACSGYERRKVVDPELSFRSVEHDIMDSNERGLHAMIWRDVQRNEPDSWERKIKHFFKSCMDEYLVQERRGKPLVAAIRNTGGWSVIDQGQDGPDASWAQYRTQLQKMLVDYRVWAFFKIEVHPAPDNSKNNIIRLSASGLGMEHDEYLGKRKELIQLSYMTFVRTVGMLAASDAGMNTSDPDLSYHVDRFAQEVYDLETKIANATAIGRQGEDHNTLINLAGLKEICSQVDWSGILSASFPEAGITDETQVMLDYQDYFVQLNYLIEKTLRPRKNGYRIMNNYLVWRMMQSFVPVLPAAYTSAAIELETALTGTRESKSRWRMCFSEMTKTMPLALSALYVKGGDRDQNLRFVLDEILPALLESLDKQIDGVAWMDALTKTKAKEKVSKMKQIIGQSDSWMDDAVIDGLYKQLSISQGRLFENAVSWRSFDHLTDGFLLKNGVYKQTWKLELWTPVIEFFHSWNEIVVPAGALQSPLVDKALPMPVNLAAIGSRIGRHLLSSIDIIGSHYAPDGTVKHWWGEGTLMKYVKVWQCYVRYWNNTDTGPWKIEGINRSVYVNAASFANYAIRDHGGLKQAFSAHKAWQNKGGKEVTLPFITNYSGDKAFFVAYAQSHCTIERQQAGYDEAKKGYVPQRLRVNAALKQFPQFAKTFDCPANSKMVADEMCRVF